MHVWINAYNLQKASAIVHFLAISRRPCACASLQQPPATSAPPPLAPVLRCAGRMPVLSVLPSLPVGTFPPRVTLALLVAPACCPSCVALPPISLDGHVFPRCRGLAGSANPGASVAGSPACFAVLCRWHGFAFGVSAVAIGFLACSDFCCA
jgi:hypothetical protein